MDREYFMAISNGDFDIKGKTLKQIIDDAEWELETGQDWAVITIQKLSSKQLDAIMEILKK